MELLLEKTPEVESLAAGLLRYMKYVYSRLKRKKTTLYFTIEGSYSIEDPDGIMLYEITVH